MSEGKKPREFKLGIVGELKGDGDDQIFIHNEGDTYMILNPEDGLEIVSVIEKSAYEKAIEALKHIYKRDLSCGACNDRVDYSVREHDEGIAEDALKELGELV